MLKINRILQNLKQKLSNQKGKIFKLLKKIKI
jgi:hypothetical protein